MAVIFAREKNGAKTHSEWVPEFTQPKMTDSLRLQVKCQPNVVRGWGFCCKGFVVLFLGVEAPDVPRKMQTEYEPDVAAPLLRETHVWAMNYT